MHGLDTVKVSVSEAGVQGELSYTMLRDVVITENECVPVYGIAVSFTSGGQTELCKLHNVTDSQAEMAALMEKMASGLVFPVSLRDIVEDFIA